MTRHKLGILVFMLLVISVMLYAHHRFSLNPAWSRSGGSLAPDFQLQTLDGSTLRLSDYHGKAVLLNFWATWCPPCREEIPWFVNFQRKYGPQGLQVIGVSVDNGDLKEVTDFTEKLGVNYPVLLANDRVTDEYGGVQDLPTTIYIGRDGHITQFVEGLVSRHEVEQNIRQALATSPPKEPGDGSLSPQRASLDLKDASQGAN